MSQSSERPPWSPMVRLVVLDGLPLNRTPGSAGQTSRHEAPFLNVLLRQIRRRRGRTQVPSDLTASIDSPRLRGATGMDKEQEKAAKARDAALTGALSQIERQFGKGSVMRMGDEDAVVRVSAIPTGALSLDIALGVGGMPRGRIVEV